MSKPAGNNFSTDFIPEVAGVELSGNLLVSKTCDRFGIDRYTGVIFYIEIGTVTGTNPTLDIKLRTLMPNDQPIQVAASAQITVAGKYGFGCVSSGNTVFTDATLLAGTFRAMPLGDTCDILFTVGGTATPTFPINALHVILIQ